MNSHMIMFPDEMTLTTSLEKRAAATMWDATCPFIPSFCLTMSASEPCSPHIYQQTTATPTILGHHYYHYYNNSPQHHYHNHLEHSKTPNMLQSTIMWSPMANRHDTHKPIYCTVYIYTRTTHNLTHTNSPHTTHSTILF